MVIPSRTKKEYYDDNKEMIKEYKKEYSENNKEIIAEKQKIKYEKNKEIIAEKAKIKYEKNKEIILKKQKEKITCECGICISRIHLARHKKSIKHQQFIESLKTNV
jgi:hypothetical protein